MIISKFEEARLADEQTRKRLLFELASRPDETLMDIVAVLGMAAKPLWKLAIQVIRLIGYPRNAVAIPALIDQIADSNSPAWGEAMQALLDMGPAGVIPHFLQTMLD